MSNLIILCDKSTIELRRSLKILREYLLEQELDLLLIVKPNQLDLANSYNCEFPQRVIISVLENDEILGQRLKYLKSRFKYNKILTIINKPLQKSSVNRLVKSQQIKKVYANKSPLVSVVVYNYNYGKYIGKCLESIFSQTYQNFVVCISDNSSDDESWTVISNFIKKYPKKIRAIKNKINMGPGFNKENAENLAVGEYIFFLTSDDYIDPRFLEKTTKLLESNKDCAFAMVHRDIVTESGELLKEKPFYDATCKIDGHSQSAVFMMAGVNPSISQIVYRRSMIKFGSLGGNALNIRWFGARIQDFEICCEHPIIYIKEPLLKNRVHSSSDGNGIDRSLIQPIGQFLLLHQFRDIAAIYNNKKAADRLPQAISKLSDLCLRYSVNFLAQKDEKLSEKYFYLGMAFKNGNDINIDLFNLLFCYHINKNKKILNRLGEFNDQRSRLISYEPPDGYIKINLK